MQDPRQGTLLSDANLKKLVKAIEPTKLWSLAVMLGISQEEFEQIEYDTPRDSQRRAFIVLVKFINRMFEQRLQAGVSAAVQTNEAIAIEVAKELLLALREAECWTVYRVLNDMLLTVTN